VSPAVSVGLDLRFFSIVPPPGWPSDDVAELAAARRRAGLSIAEAAALLQIEEMEYAAVERGTRVFVDPEAFEAAIGAMATAGDAGKEMAGG